MLSDNRIWKHLSGIPFFILLFLFSETQAQLPTRLPRPIQGNLPGMNQPDRQSDTTKPTRLGFEHRDDLADSITISYRQFDSTTAHSLDTSIDDFGKYSPLPTGYLSIGGIGNSAFPILFTPEKDPGADPGFHAYDVYKFTLENTRFYQTTRPFTMLHYYQGSGTEQTIKALHTQNIRPNWNAGFNLRIISNPGIFQNQNSKHNNYRFFSTYQGRKKRYAAEVVVLANKLVSAENGGITDPSLLNDPNRKRRIAIPVELGNNSTSSNIIFSNQIQAGNRYNDMDAFFRHRYDIGKRDSIIVNDSTKEYLFYPKLRFQHTARYQELSYQFIDNLASPSANLTDSAFFDRNYNIKINPSARSFYYLDKWEILTNDFTLKQFPETKNQNQFLEAGIRLQNYKVASTSPFIPDNILAVNPLPPVESRFFSAAVHGEYRNKTRNRKWDALLNGQFYIAGSYAGDYSALASVERFLNPKWGAIKVSFNNISRTPSYVFQSKTAFNLDTSSLNKKENITILGFEASNKRFDLMVRNISIANYAYFANYYQKEQNTGLINLTQGTLSTKNKIVGHLNLYSDFTVQVPAGNTPIRVPLLYTRQRLAFEGLFFKNLHLSTGLDVRYNTPYKANHYSPIPGRFFPQDSIRINNLPTLNAFCNFTIKKFTLFLMVENLNTLEYNEGLGFTRNNFTAPYYPSPGFILRLAVKWEMVN